VKRIAIILLILSFSSFTGCDLFSGSSFSEGTYINGDIGFSMELPLDWHKVSKPDFLQSMAFTGVKQRFFASPTEAEDILIVVSTVSVKKLPEPGQLDKLWNTIVRNYKSSGLKVDLDTEEDINDINIKRLGGNITYHIGGHNTNYYIEMDVFIIDKGMAQIDFMFREPVSESRLSELDGIIRSIQKID